MYIEFIKNVFLKRITLTLLTLLMMITFVFLSYSLIQSNIAVVQGKQRLAKLIESDVFVGNDQSTNSQFQRNFSQKNVKKTNDQAQNTYDYLKQNFHFSQRWTFNSNLASGKSITIDTINRNFLDFYSLPVHKGRGLNKSDFTKHLIAIPVIAGPGIGDKVKLGQQYHIFNPANGKKEIYKIVGILDPNVKIQSIYLLDSSNVLNNTFFRPLRSYDENHINATELFSSLQDLLIYKTDRSKINRLQKIIQSNNFFTVKFFSVKKDISDFYSSYVQRMITFSVFFCDNFSHFFGDACLEHL